MEKKINKINRHFLEEDMAKRHIEKNATHF